METIKRLYHQPLIEGTFWILMIIIAPIVYCFALAYLVEFLKYVTKGVTVIDAILIALTCLCLHIFNKNR